jgi:O-antigen/teichoic acid export membrane protein
MAMVGFGVCLTVSFGAELLVSLMYGPSFEMSGPVLGILIWFILPVFLGGMLTTAFVANGQPKLVPIGTVAGGILNVALNAALIPKFGIIGAAWANVLSYNIANFALFFFLTASRQIAMVGVRASFSPAASAAASLAIGLLVPNELRLPVAIAVYLVGLRLLGAWTEADTRELMRAISGRLNMAQAS